MRKEDLDFRFDILLNEFRMGLANRELSLLKLIVLCEEYLSRDNMPRKSTVEGHYRLCLLNLR